MGSKLVMLYLQSWYSAAIFCWLIITNFGIASAADIKEYCFQKNNFNVTCPLNHVILIEQAMYGRMGIGRCLKQGDKLGCSANVLPQMQERCTGKRHCYIAIPDPKLHAIARCPENQISYLAAAYICQKVVTPDIQKCTRKLPVNILEYPGYISSKPLQTVKPYDHSCDFNLAVPHGQKINITLMDYSAQTNKQTGCKILAKVKEEHHYESHNICGGNTFRNQKKVYTSIGNKVTVELMIPSNNGEESQPFMLKYEAIGCADPVTPHGSWYKREEGDQASVHCNFTLQKWHIVCRGSEWVGLVENCTGYVADDERFKQDSHTFPFSLLVAVLIGVCIGVILGIGLLCFVSCVLKQQRSDRVRRLNIRDADGPEHTIMLQHKLYPCDHSYECTTSTNLPPPPPPVQRPKIPQYVTGNLTAECNMNCPCNTWNKCPEHHQLHIQQHHHQKLPSLIKDSEESLQQQHFWDTSCPPGEECTVVQDDNNKGTDTQQQHIRLKNTDNNNEDLISHWPCQGQVDTVIR